MLYLISVQKSELSLYKCIIARDEQKMKYFFHKKCEKNMKSNEKERSRVRDYQQGQSIKNAIKRYEIACKNINEITWKKKVVRTSE